MLDKQKGKFIFECDGCTETLETGCAELIDANELVHLTVDNHLLAFRITAGEPWHGGRSCWELCVLLGKDKVPEAYVSARAMLTIGLGRTYESVLDHNHVRSWKRFLPWPNWFRWGHYWMGGRMFYADSARWTGRTWTFTGIDWPWRFSFWRGRQ